MESHSRNMAPPPRTGYRTTFTHTSPQNVGPPSYVGAHPAFYGQNMIPYPHDNQLRLDLHQQQQQQQSRGFQNVNVAGGHYTYHQASPPTPQYHYGYYGEGPVSPVIPAGPARGRASSRSSGSSAASSTSPVLDLNGSSDIEADDSSTSRGRGVHHVHQTSGYPFPAVPSTPTDSVVGSYVDSCAEALVNGPGEDLQSVDGGSQRGPQRNSRNGQHENGHRAKRRPSSGNQSNGLSGGDSKYRKSSFKQQQQQQHQNQDSYVLRVLEDDLQPLAAAESDEGVPLSTLADDEYRSVFSQLNELFCRTSYRWLAQYKFRIPRKRYMKDHVSPFDRELTEYVQIIKNLVEGREVPRNAVLDDRLNELVSIMEGASEIRHVNIHVSRRHKPDRRVLGFIAAVNEFCWILGDQRGAMKTNQMYARVEAMTLENRRKLQAEKELQSQQQQQARATLLEKESQKPARRTGKSNSPSPSPERNVAPAAASKEVATLA